MDEKVIFHPSSQISTRHEFEDHERRKFAGDDGIWGRRSNGGWEGDS